MIIVQSLLAKRKHGKLKGEKTVQHWTPVEDINNNFIYRRDNYIVAVLKVEPINIDLLSESEKRKKIKSLYVVLNGIQAPMQWLSIGRAVDLDAYITQLELMAINANNFLQKKLLKGYIRQAADMALSGETLERQFYILMPMKNDLQAEGYLLNTAKEVASNLSIAGLSTQLCSDQKIIELLFTFNNPIQAAYESIPSTVGPYLPSRFVGDFSES